MKKQTSIGFILASLSLVFASSIARADDGEGLSTPREGTPERAAYDAANAQYEKDDGNPAYHLQAIKVLNGSTMGDDVTYEVDFNSVEDGDYDYRVEVRLVGKKWVAGQATSI